ncbi:MAG: hypothetical protein WED15_08270, partial [Akkermansiaceae bacterium]
MKQPTLLEKNSRAYSISVALCVVLAALMVWLRLGFYGDRIFSLASGLPLLLCLWNRDLRLLYAMATVFAAAALLKSIWMFPTLAGGMMYFYVYVTSQMINIWLVAGVIHYLILSKNKIEQINQSLDLMNVELEASNEELAASNEELTVREEEITCQNEELQSQTEELEQQAEELRQQSEETEHQSAELHELNAELQRKDRGLQILLETGRWLRGEMSEHLVMNGICQATVQVFDDGVHAAAVAINQDGNLSFKGA